MDAIAIASPLKQVRVPANPLEQDRALVRPIERSGWKFWAFSLVLVGIWLWGMGAWIRQLESGLEVTGLNVPVYWGLYITNFVFFIGISHAGTLISAILRLCNAEWRRPITRAAEIITVLVLFFGAGCVILDLGRPDRVLNVLLHPNFRSPLVWDVCSISVYLTASMVYLFLPLIPDIALLRDHTRRHRWLYRPLALGWTGTPRQKRNLNRAIAVMAVLVIPVAVSVHTVVSWVFAMTVQPMWHSTIFGPYFVVGAIFSGIGAILIAMAVVRRVYHLEAYLKPIHFHHLGLLLLVMALLWVYFTFAEFLTTYYGSEPSHMAVFRAKISGPYAPLFWTMIATCFVIPFTLLVIRPVRSSIWGCVTAAVSVEIGMWLERYLIVVPSLSHPRLPRADVAYQASWVEWALLASFLAFFVFLYGVFSRFFPIVSIWEMREGREHALDEVVERVRKVLPGVPEAAP
ncbi:MAG TPA: NrfD/PsrC family molybdoenzyme membrane anchor subunit [Gemmatimonadales bacterium]|nr:NrfD/PsrC family molybdoenzyme membrane anchor subunit [Gemmatimonadales bacterium]